jgi:hypothetical protein
MGGACSTHWRDEVGLKPDGTYHFENLDGGGRLILRLILTNYDDGWDGVDRIRVTQDK